MWLWECGLDFTWPPSELYTGLRTKDAFDNQLFHVLDVQNSTLLIFIPKVLQVLQVGKTGRYLHKNEC